MWTTWRRLEPSSLSKDHSSHDNRCNRHNRREPNRCRQGPITKPNQAGALSTKRHLVQRHYRLLSKNHLKRRHPRSLDLMERKRSKKLNYQRSRDSELRPIQTDAGPGRIHERCITLPSHLCVWCRIHSCHLWLSSWYLHHAPHE